MTKVQVSNYIVESTPFEADELTEAILGRIIFNSLKVVNRYLPKIIRGSNEVLANEDNIKRNIRPLRTYQDKFTHSWDYPLSNLDILDSGGVSGFFVYCCMDYTLDDIDEDLPSNAVVNTSAFYFFTKLLEAHAYMYCGNKRRSAVLNDLPFDIKGDSFEQEGAQMVKDIEVEMANAMDNSI